MKKRNQLNQPNLITMSESNADRVKKIIVSQLNVSEEQVLPEASFIDDLGADSLDQVELVMALVCTSAAIHLDRQ